MGLKDFRWSVGSRSRWFMRMGLLDTVLQHVFLLAWQSVVRIMCRFLCVRVCFLFHRFEICPCKVSIMEVGGRNDMGSGWVVC